jgi:hypothetical protein
MATLATRFGRFFAQEGERAEAAFLSARSSDAGTRVRPFANEDIYFFVKNINNATVIREADPQAERASWGMIGMAAAAAVLVIGMLMPKGYGILAGYEIQALHKEHARLMADRASLEVSEAALMSPERMAVLAKQQQYIDPPSDHVVYLETTSDTTVASISK